LSGRLSLWCERKQAAVGALFVVPLSNCEATAFQARSIHLLRRSKKYETQARERKASAMSFTRTVDTAATQAIAAPFPNTKGTVTIKVLNSDQSLGPAVVLLRMEPGSEIARHMHERTTETAYVLDGDFMDEGISYPVGTEWNVKPLTAHGPHTTKTGCSVLVTYSYPSALDDFKLA
jgi:hypothetical protein